MAESRAGLVSAAVDAAVSVSAAEVERFISAARRARTDMGDDDLIRALERSFTGLVATSGAAAGGVAALPAVGTAAGAAVGVVDAGAFTTAAMVYVLAVASVHGIDVEDLERRKALLLAVLIGPGGPRAVERVAGRTGAYWGRQVTEAVPLQVIRRINKVLGHNFVTRYGTKQGIVVIGKMAPFGLGAAIGATGNTVMARMTIKTARAAFGPLPASGVTPPRLTG